MWGMIPVHQVHDGRIMVVLDDSINPKSGRKILKVAHIFTDHSRKSLVNQSSYPCVTVYPGSRIIEKNKICDGACLPLDFRFYMMKKNIET